MKKRIIFGLLTLSVSLSSFAQIINGPCGENIQYTLDTETGVLTLKGEGTLSRQNLNYWPWDKYKETIRKVVADDAISFPTWNWLSGSDSIMEPQYNNKTFIYMPRNYNQGNQYSYKLPKGIKAIASYAFYNCTNMTSVTVNAECEEILNSAFNNCSALKSASLPEGLQKLGGSAFYYCYNLTSFKLPNSVESVGSDCFYGCSQFKNGIYNDSCFYYFPAKNITGEFTIPGNPKKIAPGAFNNTSLSAIIIPSSVEVIEGSAFYYCSNLKNVQLPENLDSIKSYAFSECENLTDINFPDGLKYIGEFAFRNCDCLTSVTLPDNLKYIGVDAFSNCGKLTNVKLPDNIDYWGGGFSYCSSLQSINIPNNIKTIPGGAFRNCSSLKDIILPASLETISNEAFWGCSSLENIVLPNQLKAVDAFAFSDCKSLKSINLPESVVRVGNNVFQNCTNLAGPIHNSKIFAYLPNSYEGDYKLPEGITQIAGCAFYNCHKLKNVNLPESITTINYAAFYGCKSLRTINLPKNITGISDQCFHGCDTLDNIILPSNITTIGYSAFSGCSSLKEIKIPEKVQLLNGYAFYNCTSLTDVTLPAQIDSIGVSAFGNCPNLKNPISTGKKFYACPTGSTTCIVPEGIEEIDSYAFANCKSLKEVELPNTLKRIGAYAFQNCSSLNSIHLPAQLDSIGTYIFENCTTLEIVNIPANIDYIPAYAFSGCKRLSQIQLHKNIKGIMGCAFLGCINLKQIDLPENLQTLGYRVFGDCSNLQNISIPQNVKSLHATFALCTGLKSVTLQTGLMTIEYGCFEGCQSLTDINIPSTVSSIGSNAFRGCTSLKEINLPDMITSLSSSSIFYECTNLERIKLPSNLKDLELSIFNGCHSLRRLDIPATTTSIDYYSSIDSLEYISVGEGNPNYSSSHGILCDKEQTKILLFPRNIKDLVFPQNITNINYYDISNLNKIRSVTLPFTGRSKESKDEERILGSIFNWYASSVNNYYETINGTRYQVYEYEYKLPQTLKKIVLNCDSLNNTHINFKGKKYNNNSSIYFYKTNCDGIDTLIVNCKTDVNPEIFSNFKNLQVLDVNRIDKLNTGSMAGMDSLAILSIDKVNTMEARCFADLKALKELTIPFAGAGSAYTAVNFGTLFGSSSNDEMKRVVQFMEDGSNSVYYLPAGLEKVTLLDGCETLSYGAFYGCNMIKELTLPSSLYMVGEKALYGCAGLKDIYCKGADPASAFSNTFEGVRTNSCKLHVPYGASEMYKRSTGWKDFYYIEEEAPLAIVVENNIINAGVIYGLTQFKPGETAELKAIAHSGYKFLYWREGSQVVSEEATYTFVVEGNRILTAVFAPVNDSNDMQVAAGSTKVQFVWKAEEGASFYQINIYKDIELTELAGYLRFDKEGQPLVRNISQLSATIDGLDASTTYYYSVSAYNEEEEVISQYTGTFSTTESTGIYDLQQEQKQENVYHKDGCIVISNASGSVAQIYNLSGNTSITQTIDCDYTEIPLEKGLYLVRINERTHKILVR